MRQPDPAVQAGSPLGGGSEYRSAGMLALKRLDWRLQGGEDLLRYGASPVSVGLAAASVTELLVGGLRQRPAATVVTTGEAKFSQR